MTRPSKPRHSENDLEMKTHAERCLAFLDSGHESDLTILAGKDKVPVRAHKLFLSIGSPVLRGKLMTKRSEVADLEEGDDGTLILRSLFAEKAGDKSLTLEMPEMSSGEVMTFLKFLYAGEYPENVEYALLLLQAAVMYEIPELAQHCGLLLESKVTDDTVLQLYEQAKLFKDEYLQKSTLDYISKRAAKIVELRQFSEINIETLKTLLERGALAVLNEIQLFEGTMRWAYAEIERQKMVSTAKYLRTVLEKVIHLIRFPQMTSADFSMKVATSQVLTSDEIVAVLLYFNIPEAKRQAFGTGLFNPKPRQYFSPTGNCCQIVRTCLNRISANPVVFVSSIPLCVTKFQVNVPIWIRSLAMQFNCFGASEGLSYAFGAQDVLKIKIEDESGSLLSKKTISLASQNVRNLQTIELDRDLLINKDTLHLINFRLNTVTVFKYFTSDFENLVEYEDAEGQSKVQFDFTGTVPSEQFVEGLEIHFLVD